MRSLPLASMDHGSHVSFASVASYLRAALLLGSGGGFALATVLTLAPLFDVPLNSWWLATAQTHGHLQLFGWAGLFVSGVALYFLPRLRGMPLARPGLLPWILGAQVTSLLLRFLSQPLLVVTAGLLWKITLALSGVLEALALLATLLVLAQTILRPATTKKTVEGIRSIAPFIFGAFLALALAGILNLFNCGMAIANNGQVPVNGDEADITLGLFGFLVPVALAMSARMLPLYMRIQPFPPRLLRILALTYFGGIIFWLLSLLPTGQFSSLFNGLALLLIGLVMLIFTGYFLYLIRTRMQPRSAAPSISQAETFAARAERNRREERRRYGPYIALIGSAYLWGTLGALLLVLDGLSSLLFQAQPVTIDAIRHSFAIGFITLLICGIAVRIVPGFSSKAIRSAGLVTATLVLGNLAGVLRVGSLLLSPLLPGSEIFFALSGPTGLALVLCFTVNLWPAL